MKTLTLDITSKCNMDCEFCYSQEEGELSVEDVKELVEEHNPEKVELGGGEPFMHPGLVDVVRYLIDAGKKVSIATNGTLIQSVERGAFDFASRENLHFQVSLPAAESKRFREITKNDYFGWVYVNARNLLEEGFPVAFSSAIYQGNYDQVQPIITVAHSLMIPVRFNLVFPVGKGKDVGLLNRRQVEELRSALLEERIVTSGIAFADSPLLHPNTCPALEETYGLAREAGCPALKGDKIHIAPDKGVHQCEFYRGEQR